MGRHMVSRQTPQIHKSMMVRYVLSSIGKDYIMSHAVQAIVPEKHVEMADKVYCVFSTHRRKGNTRQQS
jgi:hypothetical protein